MTTKILIAFIVMFVLGIFFFRQDNHSQQNKAIQTSNRPTASINGHVFLIELAKTEAERERGLSYRPSLPQDQGMLFLFESPGKYSFWMKDMHFALDMIYIKGDTVMQIFENVPPPDSSKQILPIYTPQSNVDKVLEINAGLSQKYGIKIGDRIDLKL